MAVTAGGDARAGIAGRLAPAAVLAGAAGVLVLVAVVDPETPGHYPTCPFLSVTGLYCPGCGSLRALHALTHGDLATAVERNVLAVAAVPLLGVLWLLWAGRATAGRPAGTRSPVAALWALLGLVVAFWVLRNVPAGAWLAP